MTIFINDKPEILKDAELTVAELLAVKGISPKGTAVALNGRLVKRGDWETQVLSDSDKLTIISAAYGG